VTEELWFFAFRQLHSVDGPGAWVAWGPYPSRKDAQAASEQARAGDAQVGQVFLATSRAEADKKAARFA
jgi:hypothetical protein